MSVSLADTAPFGELIRLVSKYSPRKISGTLGTGTENSIRVLGFGEIFVQLIAMGVHILGISGVRDGSGRTDLGSTA